MNNQNQFSFSSQPQLGLLPFQRANITLNARPHINIPPFPSNAENIDPNSKRPLTPSSECGSAFEEIAPVKKIKFDSFNLLSKASFADYDPYRPEANSIYETKFENNISQPLTCKQLDGSILKQKGITIDFSSKKKVDPSKSLRIQIPPLKYNQRNETISHQNSLQLLSLLQNTKRHFDVPVLPTADYSNYAKTPNLDLRPLTNLTNSFQDLLVRMQDMIALRQAFQKKDLQTPAFDIISDETRPGTPNTFSMENLSEPRSSSLGSADKILSQESIDEETESIDQPQVTSASQTEIAEEDSEQSLKRKYSTSESDSSHGTSGAKKKAVERRRNSKDMPPQNLYKTFEPKYSETGRRRNRLQALKAERDAFEIEMSKPYFISVFPGTQDPNQRIVNTRTGKEYQIDMSSLVPQSEEIKRSPKLVYSPDTTN